MGNVVWNSGGSTEGNLAGNYAPARVPTAGDTWYGDATSVVNCIFSAGLTCDGINVTAAYSGDGDFSDSSLTFTFASDCTFAGPGTWDRGNATIHFQGDVATAGQTAWADNGSTIILDGSNDQDVDLSGCDDADIEEDKPAGTVTLVDACDCASFTGTSGTLDVNGQTVTSSGAVTFSDSANSGFSSDVPAVLSGFSYQFDGVDDYVGLGLSLSASSVDYGRPYSWRDDENWSMAFWYKGTDTGSANWGGAAIFGFDSGVLYAQISIRNNKCEYSHYDAADGGWQHNLASTTSVNNGAWHHCLVVNHSDRTADIYVDGVKEVTAGSSDVRTAADGLRYFQVETLLRGFSARYTSGLVDDIRMYEQALTQNNATYLHTNGASGDDPGTANLQGHWKLDGDFTDETANNNDGTRYGCDFEVSALDGSTIDCNEFDANGQTLSSTGGFSDDVPSALGSGQSWEADGVDDRIKTSAAMLNAGVTRWSLCAWVYRSGAGTTGWGNGIIYESTDNEDNFGRYVFKLEYSNNKITFGYRDAPGGDFDGLHQGDSAVGTGAWHHVAVIVDTVANTASFFLDGVADGVRATEGKGALTTAGNIRVIGAGQHTNANSVYHGWFDGHLDDVRIYDSALSPANVATLAAGGDVAGAVGHWTLDGDFLDSSGNANHGTLYGQTWYLNCTTSGSSVSNTAIGNCIYNEPGGVKLDASDGTNTDLGGNSGIDFGGANRRRRLLMACGA